MRGVDIEKIKWNRNKKDDRTEKAYIATTETGKEFTFNSKYKANSTLNLTDAFCTLIQFADAEDIVSTRRA